MPNRLSTERSPYLLQHAGNPVDWYPWGRDAFERARREDKPIFLSVGYSTCHWCHVMERESFENEEIARVLNEHFIAVKVDREERPDVDRVYMAAVQMMTGSGGWPMSLFLTPELSPFYGGTYYPPLDMHGRPGFKTVLERIHEFWIEEKEKVVESGRQLVAMLEEERLGDEAQAVQAARGAEPDAALLDAAYAAIASDYDEKNAGFGRGAKFPRPVVLTFLYRYYRRTKNEDALKMALTTLMAMSSGGMYDHLGGGFHRYAVDPGWRVPHFEKMLYDQAQLIYALADAFMITRDEAFARPLRETIEYVLRDMRGREGEFFSAEDADSPEPGAESAAHSLKEGAFYVWSKEEVDSLLTPQESKLACAYYSIAPEGNVRSDPHGEFFGKNILFAPLSVAEAAARCSVGEEEAERMLAEAKKKLFEARARRPRPFRDDKVIAGWNGLMIGALARAASVVGEPGWLQAAEGAADVLFSRLYDKETKTLRRISRAGESAGEAHLDDYAFVTHGCLELHRAAHEEGAAERWLSLAEALTGTQEALFWDAAEGGFFETSGKDPTVLVRMKEAYDGAEPAGNSMAAMNLVRLARLTSKPSYQQQARRTLRLFAARIGGFPQAMPLMMSAVDEWLSPGEFICTPEGCALPSSGS